MNTQTAESRSKDETKTYTVLLIDDIKENLSVMGELLHPLYRVRLANSGRRGLLAAASEPYPDLILLDIMMPEMDGYEVLAKLRENPVTSDIPVIFVTAMDSDEDEERGLGMGVIDYITKPVRPAIFLARVRNYLEIKRNRDALKNQNAALEAKVQERTRALKISLDRTEDAHAKLRKTYFGILHAFGELAELRGGRIGIHSQHVADLVRQVAIHMDMTDSERQDVFVAALLHDIGMIGFPDELFHKPVSALHGGEVAMYQQHPGIGARVIGKIEKMQSIADIIHCHHEHYDGTGFPVGLSGLNIPLGARIIAAVSDYESLIQGTLTTHPMTPKQACQFLVEERGHRYDPQVIDALEPLLESEESFEIDEIRVSAHHLQEGMMVSREIRHPEGFLLLSKSTVVTRSIIDHLVDVEKRSGNPLEIYVVRQRISH